MRTFIFAFIFSAVCPAAFLSAGDAPPAGVLKSTAPGGAAAGLTDMALIPGGEFVMGSAEEEGSVNEHPSHKVFLSPYYMDKYEVTAARYKSFAAAAGKEVRRQPFPDKENCPVVYVHWYEASAFCEYYGKRLPTEAEWEMAARGGSDGKYCFGSDAGGLGEYAWYWSNSGKKIHPVGQKKPNDYGLYDMHGNVLEWTADWSGAGYYAVSPGKNPAGPEKGEDKVVRGGSAYATADMCRSAHRMKSSPYTPYSGKGFRCAAPAVPAAAVSMAGSTEAAAAQR